MAKRKKSGKRTKGRKRGMGAMPKGSKARKAALFLTTVVSASLAEEGMQKLYEMDIMKVTVKEGEKAPKINIKKAIASGGALALSGAGAVMLENDWAVAIATGIGATAGKYLKDDVAKPVLGMGAVNDFLNLYKKDMKGTNENSPVQLRSVEKPINL